MSDNKLYHYVCLYPDCNKEHDDEKCYPYGWICPEHRTSQKLIVKCHDCGKDMELSWSRYRILYPDETWRCPECNKKHLSEIKKDLWKDKDANERKEYMKSCHEGRNNWENNLSSKEKDERNDFLNQIRKDFYDNETLEDKQKRSEFHHDRWMKKSLGERQEHMMKAREALLEKYKNETPEEKELRRQFLIDIAKLSWIGLNKEEREIRLKPLRDGNKKYYENRSEEKRLTHNTKLSLSNKEYWKNLSEEKIIERLTPAWNGWMIWYNNLSNKEKEAHNEFLKIISNDYFNNQTEEQKQIRSQNISKGLYKFYEKESYEERLERDYQIALRSTEKFNCSVDNKSLSKTELQFKYLLIDNDISYNLLYSNTKVHPDFDIMFPYNPYTKYNYVSPYHEWDFILYLNGTNIFVDIDGSHHNLEKMNYCAFDPKLGIDINMANKQYFYDMQRAYQTDGFDAYIIKCYDDDIYADNVKVQNLKTNEEITLQEFIKYIKNVISENHIKMLNKKD